jgi:hypothetical protein
VPAAAEEPAVEEPPAPADEADGTDDERGEASE